VVYVDFWGTSCGPCLVEFRNFIGPLKDRYRENKQVQFLYISSGSDYLWKRQIEKYGLEGYHLFLDDEQYSTLFRNAIGNDTASILIPRYMIIDQKGKIVVKNAKRPSDKDLLFAQIDKYLLSSNIDKK
jgi:peroxiredoxin